MARRSIEPLLWSLFSAGGVVSAFFMPVLIFLFGIAFPLGLIEAPGFQSISELIKHPITRLVLMVVCIFPLFHWAHRFRFTLYDGLQIKHLNEVIAVVCYGGALFGTVLAGYLLWNIG
ncbi:MAG: fumarate reductase subunit D [Acidobacteria bacterium]|nr:fumarate reductase subunit D [Acidobacteriota bacterium]MCW5970144.1 hypothetical protein [Blastocatellales bacterium]